jgi:hypothetical protein
MCTFPPKYKVGDTILWYCNDDDRVHQSVVQFVNFAKAGDSYLQVNYEIREEYQGTIKTIFVDDYDVLDSL